MGLGCICIGMAAMLEMLESRILFSRVSNRTRPVGTVDTAGQLAAGELESAAATLLLPGVVAALRSMGCAGA